MGKNKGTNWRCWRTSREATQWCILQNYKNRNGEAPLVKNFKRDAYKRIADTLGVERYQVNGLLQVGDGDGPVVGEVGYGESVPNATVQIRGQTFEPEMHRKTIKSS